ncbi:MAG: insulinase family protein [Verrucomicrobia bacterium]|nr:MAG: insulinase family protein [Verrucomicrobiota bacterium]
MRRYFLAVCLMLLCLPVIGGESLDTLKVLERSNAHLRRVVLDNGMIVLIKEDHSAPVAAVQIWVGSGAVHEDEFLGSGLSHFVEHMIFKGTPTRAPGDIMRETSDLGGKINAYTAQDRTVFHITLPSKHWNNALDILGDAVMHATFPADEWKREQEVILREFAMGRDNPDRELGETLWDTAYRVHPYRVPVIGYEPVYKARSRDDLLRYFHEHYVPNNMIAVIVGDVQTDEVEARVRKTFVGFERRASKPVYLPPEPTQLTERSQRKLGDYNVSRLGWAWHTVGFSHPDAPVLQMLSVMVGGGRSSRLVAELKEKKKLVFDVDAFSDCPQDPGLFGVSARFDPAKEAEVIAALRANVAEWHTTKFSAAEIEKARRMIVVNELHGLQTMDGQAAGIAQGEFYAGDPRFTEQYLRQIAAVTAQDLQQVARRYLTTENGSLVVLRPKSSATAAKPTTEAALVKDPVKATAVHGVPVIVREDHRIPMIYLCAAVRGGLLTETETNNGITQMATELLTRGTAKRDAETIARETEQLGASLSSFAGRNSFGLEASGLAKDSDKLVDLFTDCLLRHTCPPMEIEKQRAIQLAAIEQQREQPMFLAEEALRQKLFPSHPYRLNIQGREAAVQKLQQADLLAHLRRHLVSGNLALAIFGDITPDAAHKLAEHILAKLPEGVSPVDNLVATSPTLPTRTSRREPRQQAIVLMGFPGVAVTDPREDALALLREILSGLSSDLGKEIREKRGLVYFVGASERPGLVPGHFFLYAGTREDQAAEVERLMAEQLQRLSQKGPTSEELSRAREQLLSDSLMIRQHNEGLAQACVLNELYGLGFDHSLKVEQRLGVWTDDKLRAAAAEFFRADRQVMSIVLPTAAEQAKEQKHGQGK